jgi:single-strand DNA-binding protein
MSGLNRWTGLVNLGADGELRYTQGGEPVLSLRMACTEKYRDKDGNPKESTEWIDGTFWGKRAESLAQHMTKGTRLYVEGKFTTRSYEKDGVKHFRSGIKIMEVEFTGGKREGDGDHADAAPPAERAQAPARAASTPKPASVSGGGVAYPGVKSAGDFEIRFGNDKGKMMSQIDDLAGLRAFLVKSINDPERAKYAQQNKAQVNAIDEEIARRKSGGAPAGASDAGGGDEGGYGGYGSPDDEIPFASCDAAHEQPWAQHKPHRYGMI